MKKSKIQIDPNVLDTIAQSVEISDSQKLSLLKYVGYLTYNEQQELCEMI